MAAASLSQASDCLCGLNRAGAPFWQGKNVMIKGFRLQKSHFLHQKDTISTVLLRLEHKEDALAKRWKGNTVIKSKLDASSEEVSVRDKLVDSNVLNSSKKNESSTPKDHSLPKINEGNSSGTSSDGTGGGGGNFPPGGGGGGDGNHDGGDDEEAAEFGPVLKFEEVMREAKARGVTLPSDMLEAAKSVGIRKVFLENYLNLQGAAWPLGPAVRSCSMFRNRMLVDQHFLFKVGTEVVIDSCCATFAEIQKRGKDFWSEFELYAADLVVGGVVTIALVGMLAPYARIGQESASNGLLVRIGRTCGTLPSSVFEAERPGCSFSVQQRIATFFYKGILYGAVGFGCGIVGQGIANMIMTAKRRVKKHEKDIPVPPLFRSAALWGVFLGVSSNARYQIINGLEQVVEASPLAKRYPPIALAFTVGVRFSNNIYGGMQFVDWARWSGCQ